MNLGDSYGRKPQAASRKPQAASRKPQAASRKLYACLFAYVNSNLSLLCKFMLVDKDGISRSCYCITSAGIKQ